MHRIDKSECEFISRSDELNLYHYFIAYILEFAASFYSHDSKSNRSKVTFKVS